LLHSSDFLSEIASVSLLGLYILPIMKKLVLIPILLVFVTALNAQITFNFHDGAATIGSGLELDAGGSTGNSTVSGVTLTANAFLDNVSNSSTIFNGGATGFGINAVGTGDDTQLFDNNLGIESMEFSFDVGGTFNTIDFELIVNSAEAVLSFAGGNSYDIFAGSATETIGGSTDIHTITETFLAGQKITLSVSGSAGAGESFSLQAFTITPSAIPEPSTYALIFGGLAFGVVLWKRRRAA
jgi:hypothetical protein